MSIADRVKWDARYHSVTVSDELPVDEWWAAQVSQLPPGRALDLACGLGVHAVWLAQRGWDVTGLDISPVGLEKAADLASQHGVTVAWQVVDLDDFIPIPEFWDLIVVNRYLDRTRLPTRIVAALRPSGRLIYQTFCASPEPAARHRNPEHVLRSGELPGLYSGLVVRDYAESLVSGEYYARLVAERVALGR
jgi:tellurite methyltransferase